MNQLEFRRKVSIKVHSKNNGNGGRLDNDTTDEIFMLLDDLSLLKSLGIDVDSSHSKIKAYNKFRKKALAEYGIELDKAYPFKTPIFIQKQIYAHLKKCHLNEKQIIAFYDLIEMRKRTDAKGGYYSNSLLRMYYDSGWKEPKTELETTKALEENETTCSKVDLEMIELAKEQDQEIKKMQEEYKKEVKKVKQKYSRIFNT